MRICNYIRHRFWNCIAVGATAVLVSCTSPQKNESPAKGKPSGYDVSLGVQTFDAAWNIINESHYDTNFNGVDWIAVREELRPKVAAAQNVRELRTILGSMLARLGESHMAIIPGAVATAFDPQSVKKEAKDAKHRVGEANQPAAVSDASKDKDESPAATGGDTGFDVRLIDERIVVTRVDEGSPAALAGVKLGWILQSVDEQSLDARIKALPPGTDSRHSQLLAWRLSRALLSGGPGSTVSLIFRDEADRPVPLTLTRRRQLGEPVKFGFLPTLYAHLEDRTLTADSGGKIGLLRFNVWMIPVALRLDKAIDQFRKADGIIIDLRGNVGGMAGMVMGVAGHFVGERVTLGTMKTRGNELNFFANPRLVNPAGERVEPYSGPVAILVDSVSLSATEIFAGGMKDIHRARIFGETTGGQALPAIWDRLPNGDVLYHVFANYTTASGVRLEGKGVVPDEMVIPRRADLLAGDDQVLEAAVRWIEQSRGNKANAPKEKS